MTLDSRVQSIFVVILFRQKRKLYRLNIDIQLIYPTRFMVK